VFLVDINKDHPPDKVGPSALWKKTQEHMGAAEMTGMSPIQISFILSKLGVSYLPDESYLFFIFKNQSINRSCWVDQVRHWMAHSYQLNLVRSHE
jgi:hypothetical protein